MKRLDLEGLRFGRLVVVKRDRVADGRTGWLCQCDCGVSSIVQTSKLTSGHTASCGCAVVGRTACNFPQIARRRERHGMHGTPEYRSWDAMISRCHNPSNDHFQNYGGRGVSVCPAWRESFARFLDDVGLKPVPGMNIDRIDTNGNYEPGNARWATRTENQRNMRTSKRWIVNGVEYPSLPEAARGVGVGRTTIQRWCEGGINNKRFVEPKPNCTSIKVYPA